MCIRCRSASLGRILLLSFDFFDFCSLLLIGDNRYTRRAHYSNFRLELYDATVRHFLTIISINTLTNLLSTARLNFTKSLMIHSFTFVLGHASSRVLVKLFYHFVQIKLN